MINNLLIKNSVIMKKIILLMTACVAVGTAFVACSSDDDLVQQASVVPEKTVVGTPLTVKAFSGGDDTRAIRYGEDGKEVTLDANGQQIVGSNYISEIKLWGSQLGLATPNNWLESVVFSRTGADSDTWSPARAADGTGISVSDPLTWPITDVTEPTTFYGITDGNIANADGNALNNVTEHFADGYIIYSPGTKEIDHYADGLLKDAGAVAEGAACGWVYAADPGAVELDNFDVIDNDKLGDLMVATIERTQTSDGAIPMPFEHAMCGLYVSAKFQPQNQDWVRNDYQGKFTFLGLRIHGLKTAGNYHFDTGWTDLSGGTSTYYYGFGTYDCQAGTGGKTLVAQATGEALHVEPLVPSGTWMLIPQTITGWDKKYNSAELPADNAGAYIEILYTNGDTNAENYYSAIGIYPLPDMTFVAGHNYHLIINVENIRTTLTCDTQNTNQHPAGECDYIFAPTQTTGSGD